MHQFPSSWHARLQTICCDVGIDSICDLTFHIGDSRRARPSQNAHTKRNARRSVRTNFAAERFVKRAVSRAPRTVQRTPCNAHRTPCTAHLRPYIIYRTPTPYTVYGAPQAVHCTPCAAQSTPCTVHRTPYTLHRAPHTVHGAVQRLPYNVHHAG